MIPAIQGSFQVVSGVALSGVALAQANQVPAVGVSEASSDFVKNAVPEKPLYIFVLGGPAAGKSTTIRLFLKGIHKQLPHIPTHRWDDFAQLQAMFEREKIEGFRLFRPEGDGFAINDLATLDVALKRVSDGLMQFGEKRSIHFIEFARTDYGDSLNLFDPGILGKSLLYYLQCDSEECFKRNRLRGSEGTIDAHVVPEPIMQWYYDGITDATVKSALKAAHVMYAAALSSMAPMEDTVWEEISKRIVPYF